MSNGPDHADWIVYLIRTCHNALYCGVTNDLERRFKQHQTGKGGAKSLRGKGPLTLEWHQKAESKIIAMKLEYAIKQLPKAKKEKIVNSHLSVAFIDDCIIIDKS